MNLSRIKTLIPAPESAFVVDLDNDMSSVALDSSGCTIGSYVQWVKPQAFYGSRNVLGECTIAIANEGTRDSDIEVDTRLFKQAGIKICVSDGTELSAQNDIVFAVTHPEYGTRLATFTLGAVKAGAAGATPVLHELKPSLTVMSFSRQSDGTLSPASRSLTVTVKRITGSKEEEMTIAESGLTVRFSTQAMPLTKSSGQEFPGTVTVNSNDTASCVFLAAFNPEGVLVDRESIPVVKDGENGAPGLGAAAAMFTPPVIWVEADEDGWSEGSQTFNVSATVMLNGTAIGLDLAPEVIASSVPDGLTANYNEDLNLLIIRVEGGTPPAKYEGTLKVRLEAWSDGEQYVVVGQLPVLANKKGGEGPGGEDSYSPYIEVDKEMAVFSADSDGGVTNGEFFSADKPSSLAVYVRNGVQIAKSAFTSVKVTNLSGTVETIATAAGDPYKLLYGYAYYCLSVPDSGNMSLSFQIRGGTGLLFLKQGMMRIDIEFTYDGQSLKATKTIPFIIVRQGKLGNTGPQGPTWWPAGIWNEMLTYTRTSTKYPVVEWKDEYWYPKEVGTVDAGEEPSASSTKWAKGDKFVLAIIEAVFANFGKLAAAVFSGNCMFSQYGIRNGKDSNAYQNFDAEDPFNEAKFRPNILLNFLEGYADIRGTVRAENLFHNVAVYTAGGGYPGGWYYLAKKPVVALDDPEADIDCVGDENDYAKELEFWEDYTEGKYYKWTEERSGGWYGNAPSPWFVPCTYHADVVFVIPSASNFGSGDIVNLPAPEDFPGKIVEVNSRYYGYYANEGSRPTFGVGCVIAQRMVSAVEYQPGTGNVIPSGNPAVDSRITVTAGKSYRFYSMRLGSSSEGTYYWVQMNV